MDLSFCSYVCLSRYDSAFYTFSFLFITALHRIWPWYFCFSLLCEARFPELLEGTWFSVVLLPSCSLVCFLLCCLNYGGWLSEMDSLPPLYLDFSFHPVDFLCPAHFDLVTSWFFFGGNSVLEQNPGRSASGVLWGYTDLDLFRPSYTSNSPAVIRGRTPRSFIGLKWAYSHFYLFWVSPIIRSIRCPTGFPLASLTEMLILWRSYDLVVVCSNMFIFGGCWDTCILFYFKCYVVHGFWVFFLLLCLVYVGNWRD